MFINFINNKNQKHILKTSSENELGFTLIELIVVMAVFMMIVGGAMGIFLSIISNQRRILYEQELLNQTSYIEEHMSKALRVAAKDTSGGCLIDRSSTSTDQSLSYPGYSYLLTRPITIGDDTFFSGIKFLNQSDTDALGTPACQEFFLDHAVIGDFSSPLVLKEIKTYSPYAEVGDETAIALSSDKLVINYIRFGLDGANGKNAIGYPIGDQDADYLAFQPRITILLNISIIGDLQNPTRILQTTVSQRNLNAI